MVDISVSGFGGGGVGYADRPMGDAAVPGCVRHWMKCDEGASPAKVVDSVGGVEIDPVVGTDHLLETGEAYTVRMESWGSSCGIVGNWHDFGSNDMMAMNIARTRGDPGHPDAPYDAGNVSFYMGTTSQKNIKIQPYYAVIGWGSGQNVQMASPQYKPLQRRLNGEILATMGVKRGNLLEHYTDHVQPGTNDIAKADPADSTLLITVWNNLNPDPNFYCGHSAGGEIVLCGDDGFQRPNTSEPCTQYDHQARGECEHPNSPTLGDVGNETPGSFATYAPETPTNSEWPQDYFGFLVCEFTDQTPLPGVILHCMEVMKQDWTAGIKQVAQVLHAYD